MTYLFLDRLYEYYLYPLNKIRRGKISLSKILASTGIVLCSWSLPQDVFAEIQYFTFSTQTGSGAGDSFTGVFQGDSSTGLLTNFLGGTYYGATYPGSSPDFPIGYVGLLKHPGPTGQVQDAAGTYQIRPSDPTTYFGSYSGDTLKTLNMNFNVANADYYHYSFAYPTYFTGGSPVLLFQGAIDGGSTNIAGTPTYSFTAGAPEIDGSLAPKVGFLLGCLFLMFGRRTRDINKTETAETRGDHGLV